MNEYDRFARLYDLEHQDFRDDMLFYQNLAARCDGPVLELGCGSGRVSVPLAQAGAEVTGVDRSQEMLALASRRAAEHGVAERVRFEQRDVRSMSFDAAYALALYPLNGFLHLPTPADQLCALRNACRALLPGGLLTIDVGNPHAVFTAQHDGQLLLRRRFTAPEGGQGTSYAISETDLAAQRQHMTLLYDEVGADGILRRTTVETVLRFVYRYEMVQLLERVGLLVDAVYGNYDLDPYETDSEIMLFVAYRPTRIS
jgi:ubiquinone/menaquinone biosynthesis C-methylase UbiE